MRKMEELTDSPITGLAGLKRAMETSFQQSLDIGMATVKSTLAYNREIHFAEAEERDADSSLPSLPGTNRIPPAVRVRMCRGALAAEGVVG